MPTNCGTPAREQAVANAAGERTGDTYSKPIPSAIDHARRRGHVLQVAGDPCPLRPRGAYTGTGRLQW